MQKRMNLGRQLKDDWFERRPVRRYLFKSKEKKREDHFSFFFFSLFFFFIYFISFCVCVCVCDDRRHMARTWSSYNCIAKKGEADALCLVLWSSVLSERVSAPVVFNERKELYSIFLSFWSFVVKGNRIFPCEKTGMALMRIVCIVPNGGKKAQASIAWFSATAKWTANSLSHVHACRENKKKSIEGALTRQCPPPPLFWSRSPDLILGRMSRESCGYRCIAPGCVSSPSLSKICGNK